MLQIKAFLLDGGGAGAQLLVSAGFKRHDGWLEYRPGFEDLLWRAQVLLGGSWRQVVTQEAKDLNDQHLAAMPKHQKEDLHDWTALLNQWPALRALPTRSSLPPATGGVLKQDGVFLQSILLKQCANKQTALCTRMLCCTVDLDQKSNWLTAYQVTYM